jgi:hypothetical protein
VLPKLGYAATTVETCLLRLVSPVLEYFHLFSPTFKKPIGELMAGPNSGTTGQPTGAAISRTHFILFEKNGNPLTRLSDLAGHQNRYKV